MRGLLEAIEAFNRKERFFLFSYATGNDDRGLRLSDEFRNKLGAAVGVPVPPDAKGYIDYHLDWLHAAVALAREPDGPSIRPNRVPGADKPIVSTGNQEDIDLLVAFDRGAVSWLLLIEAKAATGWTNKPVRSKADRLQRIFGADKTDPAASIQPIFCLMSPRRPAGLAPSAEGKWPDWMLVSSTNDFAWLELPVPPGRKRSLAAPMAG